MARTWLKRMAVLAACVSLSCYWALSSRGKAAKTTTQLDFAQMYFGLRSAFARQDLYDGSAPLRAFEATGWRFPPLPAASLDAIHKLLAWADYPPSTYFVLIPFAVPPWGAAQAVWFWLMAALLATAALLAWDLAAGAPALAGCMAGFVLLNSKIVLMLGNPGGMVASFGVIGAWCLLRRRYELLGVTLLALGLMMKPQEAGFVWLFFLLAGGAARKRAWQTLALAGVLGVCAAIWIAFSSPHWIPEMRSNLAKVSAAGWFANAGRGAAENFRSFDPVIGLPGVFSVFGDNARFYDLASELTGGGLILVWCFAAWRKRLTREGALLALAAVSALTLVVVYHRTHDTKILLLTIPACAALWAGGGAKRWVALGLTSAAIFATSDIPIILRLAATDKMAVSTASFSGRFTLLLLQPAPLALLAAGCFYLWAYVRYRPPADGGDRNTLPGEFVEERVGAGG